MAGRRGVAARMSIRRGVAAADLTAGHAHPEMHPAAAHLQALGAARDRRRQRRDLDRVEMGAVSHALYYTIQAQPFQYAPTERG